MALGLGLAALVARSLACFALGSPRVGPLDSDMAIAVLMANRSSGVWLFDAYYFGQDRLGAWPYLLERWVGQGLGMEWAAASLQQVHVGAALLAGLWLLGLGGRAGQVGAAAWALAVVAHPSASSMVFNLGQPYAWQLLALFGAWAVLHRQLSASHGCAARLGALWGLGTLSVWSSPVSGPLLLWLLAVEVAGRWEPQPWRERLRRALPVALALGAALLAERRLRVAYRSAAHQAFGHSYRTGVRLDTEHLADNARALAEVLLQGGGWLTLALAAAGVGALLVLRLRALRGGPPEQAPQAPLAWQPLVLALGASGMAAINYAICVAADHVRLNEYNPRYLTPTSMLLGLAAAWVGLALWEVLLSRTALAPVGAPLLALGLLGAAHWSLPAEARVPAQAELERTARLLEGQGRPRLLLGEYWRTYVYAALARSGSVVAIPAEGQYQRTPFDLGRLHEADEVVVNHAGLSDFGPAEAPHPLLFQHGALLRLVRPASPAEGFSLYTREARVPLEVQAQPALEEWDLCNPTARAVLRGQSTGPVEVLLYTPGVSGQDQPPQVELAGQALPVEVLPGLYRVHVGEPLREDTPLVLTPRQGAPGATGCRVQNVWVFPASAPSARQQ